MQHARLQTELWPAVVADWRVLAHLTPAPGYAGVFACPAAVEHPVETGDFGSQVTNSDADTGGRRAQPSEEAGRVFSPTPPRLRIPGTTVEAGLHCGYTHGSRGIAAVGGDIRPHIADAHAVNKPHVRAGRLAHGNPLVDERQVFSGRESR